jgi:hypothetical protein
MGQLSIKIHPPMQATERPIMLTLIKNGMTLTIEPDQVTVTNPTQRLAPMFFCVVDDRALEFVGRLLESTR